MAVSILPERPDSDDARALILELEGHLAQHYAAESRVGSSRCTTGLGRNPASVA